MCVACNSAPEGLELLDLGALIGRKGRIGSGIEEIELGFKVVCFDMLTTVREYRLRCKNNLLYCRTDRGKQAEKYLVAILVFKQMESSGSEIPRKTSDRIVVVHKEEIAKGETSEHIDLAVVEILGRGGSICNWGRDWVGCHFIGIVVDSKRFDDVVLLRIVTKEMLLTYPSLDKSIVASQLV